MEYMLVPSRPGDSRVIHQPGTSLFKAGKFEVLKLDPLLGGLILPVEGVYERETGFRWLGARAVFEYDSLADLRPKEVLWLNIRIGGRYWHLSGQDLMEVRLPSYSFMLTLRQGVGDYSIPIRETHGTITLVSAAGAMSPAKA